MRVALCSMCDRSAEFQCVGEALGIGGTIAVHLDSLGRIGGDKGRLG